MYLVDVSAWQSDDNGNSLVEWEKLKEAGVEGVIIKIGERDRLDKGFISHVNAAVEHGLKYGIYYYAHASNPQEAVNEAQQVDAWVREYLNGECPELGIWYDAEASGMLVEDDDITDTCSAFVSYLNGIGYAYVGIYASWNWLSKEGAHHISIDDLADYVPYWVANYDGNNTFDEYHRNYLKEEYPDNNIVIHQFTDNLDGFGFDADIYEGD